MNQLRFDLAGFDPTTEGLTEIPRRREASGMGTHPSPRLSTLGLATGSVGVVMGFPSATLGCSRVAVWVACQVCPASRPRAADDRVGFAAAGVETTETGKTS